MNICANVECGQPFTPKTHNQKYHSDDCCRRATNARLMKQYYEKKARRGGEERVCETEGCVSRLSRYNTSRVCQKCEAEKRTSARKSLLVMVTG